MSITENVAFIRSEIEKICVQNGRKLSCVKLLAATKQQSAANIREAIAAGIDFAGENKVQEMIEKLEENAYQDVPLHFIGHIQKNKIKNIVGKVDLIHSVDSVELANSISDFALKENIKQKILIEINIGNEPSKSGFIVDDFLSIYKKLCNLKGIQINGLMCIPPIAQENDSNKKYFLILSKILVDINTIIVDNRTTADSETLTQLSMGMSDDYCQAVACGATILRVGSSIFGTRTY